MFPTVEKTRKWFAFEIIRKYQGHVVSKREKSKWTSKPSKNTKVSLFPTFAKASANGFSTRNPELQTFRGKTYLYDKQLKCNRNYCFYEPQIKQVVHINNSTTEACISNQLSWLGANYLLTRRKINCSGNLFCQHQHYRVPVYKYV